MKPIKLGLALLGFSILLQACSCEPENLTKGLFWGFNKIAGEGYFPSPELIALGGFEHVEVAVNHSIFNGEDQSRIELKLYNGKSREFLENEANVARKCAELYAANYSRISEFKTIDIQFVKVDPINPENYTIAEYNFEVNDLLTKP
jgi:hypothetical protein